MNGRQLNYMMTVVMYQNYVSGDEIKGWSINSMS